MVNFEFFIQPMQFINIKAAKAFEWLFPGFNKSKILKIENFHHVRNVAKIITLTPKIEIKNVTPGEIEVFCFSSFIRSFSKVLFQSFGHYALPALKL